MTPYFILFLGVANILMAASGWKGSWLSLIVGFLCLLRAFGAFGPFDEN